MVFLLKVPTTSYKITTCLAVLLIAFTSVTYSQNMKSTGDDNKLIENMEYFIGTWEGGFDWPDGRHVTIKTNFKWELNHRMISSDTWRSFEEEPYKLYFRAMQTWNYHKGHIDLMAVNTEGLIVSGKRTRVDKDSVHLDYTAWTTEGEEVKGRDIFKIIDKDTYEWSFWRLINGTYQRQEAFDPFLMHRINE